MSRVVLSGALTWASPAIVRLTPNCALVAWNSQSGFSKRGDNLTQEEFTKMLGKPEIGYVRRRDGKDESLAYPDISVGPSHIGNILGIRPNRTRSSTSENRFYALQFHHKTLHTPLPVRWPSRIPRLSCYLVEHGSYGRRICPRLEVLL